LNNRGHQRTQIGGETSIISGIINDMNDSLGQTALSIVESRKYLQQATREGNSFILQYLLKAEVISSESEKLIDPKEIPTFFLMTRNYFFINKKGREPVQALIYFLL